MVKGEGEKVGQVSEELNFLRKDREALIEEVLKLEESLQSCLIEKTPVTSESEKETSIVSLADRIRTERLYVEEVVAKLMCIRSRLEL